MIEYLTQHAGAPGVLVLGVVALAWAASLDWW